ncbi:MAG TPA: hypothetical protein VHP83_05580 [Aggregatilineaceae bacterium]|nr:hypothetical protein [Aggregatilineaceae bacterium]
MIFGLAISLFFVALGFGILRLGIRIIRTQEFVGKRRQDNELVPYRLTGARATLMGRTLVAAGIMLIVIFGLANILSFSDLNKAGYVMCLSPLAAIVILVGISRAHKGLDLNQIENEL